MSVTSPQSPQHTPEQPISYMPGATPPVSPAPGYGPPFAYQPWPYQGPPTVAGHAAKRRNRRALIATLAAVFVLAGVVMTALSLAGAATPAGRILHPGPSAADAERECKTAMLNEMQRRMANADSDLAFGTITDVATEPARKMGDYFVVNGSVSTTITAALIGSVPNTVYLTCMARPSGSQLVTSVSNR